MRFAIYSRRALTYSTVSDFVGLAAYWRRAAKQQWYVRTSIVAASETETSTVGLNISFTFAKNYKYFFVPMRWSGSVQQLTVRMVVENATYYS